MHIHLQTCDYGSIVYDEDYFLRGKETGKSLYSNYRWLPDLTIPMVASMIRYLGIGSDDIILDFGCARGYVVRAFREMGYNAWGYDISRWALENADETVKEYLIVNDSTLLANSFDWVVAKDVLEHIPHAADTISDLMSMARVGMFAVVPLGYGDDRYVVPEYDQDVTHVHRFDLATWVRLFARPGWRVECSYRIPGIKNNYAQYEKGNGFIVARRI